MKQGPLIPNIKMPPSRICSLPWASLVAQLVKNPPAMRETWVWSLGWDGPLVKRKATHSSILAWRIPWTVWSCGCKVSDTTERLSLSECTPIKTWWGGYVAGSVLKHFPAIWLLMPVLLCFITRITWDLMNKTHTAPHLTLYTKEEEIPPCLESSRRSVGWLKDTVLGGTDVGGSTSLPLVQGEGPVREGCSAEPRTTQPGGVDGPERWHREWGGGSHGVVDTLRYTCHQHCQMLPT